MTGTPQSPTSVCDRCGYSLAGRTVYLLDGQPQCLWCALRYGPLLRRSALTALVVGSVLVLINQGDALAAGQLSLPFLWKIPLTYLVPFCVTTWGALANGRRGPTI